MGDPVRYVTAESFYAGQYAALFGDGRVYRSESPNDHRFAWGWAAENLGAGVGCWRDSRGGLWATEDGARGADSGGGDGEGVDGGVS